MNYTILGGGIAGLTAAIALKKIGITAIVFESAADIRPVGAGLLLAANAVKAYEHLGIADKIVRRGRALPEFRVLDQAGRTLAGADARRISQRYGLHNFAIHRAELHDALLGELDPAQVRTGHKATGLLELPDGRLSLQFADGSAHATDCLIVADGIHSAIRSQLAPDAATRYAGYTCWRAVIDDPGLSLSAATETWGKHGRFGIVPLAGGKIYCFACINAPQNDPRMAAMRVAELKKIFSGYHAPIPAILEQWRDDQLIWNDLADLKPLDRFAYGRVVLIGDAAHATTPNLGQGACQAIEDAVILAEMLKKHSDPEQAFRAYEQKRLPRTRFIVETSRRMGAIAQWQNPLLVCLRNVLFRLIPQSVNEKQLHQLLSVRFEE